MNDEESLLRLKHLHAESEDIRQRLRISSPNSIVFRAPISPADDGEVVVEADGLGGATLNVIEGNYPIDFLSLRETRFATERAAIEAAERLTNRAT
ncbi:MAG: hypothetical protein DME54_04820 [Verrucomicrobia bacterium]|nr:MAG: hypothetical protein DME62_08030 [Verrucomicrobiota bacterium]PYK35413.1 MAG: hypothetical protein DME54_04820 [Verrucomicrobiota bacterium]